jgi:uncharacterized membrane protein
MAAITHSIEIDRPPEEVFSYVDQLERHGEWQSTIISTKLDTEGPTRVGTRATNKRKVPGGTQDVTYEITEHDPPRKASFRGTNGPVRPVGTFTVEPVGEKSSRATIEIDFRGHGLLGLVFAPLARSQARKEIPKDHERLKERLESGA